jgi:hypothetical protein
MSKLSKSYPNWLKNPLAKEKNEMVKKNDEEGMWNKKSILRELEYWAMLDERHSIDNMHVKKSACESTWGTLLQ